MDKGQVYKEFFSKMKAAYPEKKSANVQKETYKFWNEHKNKENFEVVMKNKLRELTNLILKKNSQLMSFWSEAASKKAHTSSSEQGVNSANDLKIRSLFPSSSSTSNENHSNKEHSDPVLPVDNVDKTSNKKAETPAQDKLQLEINSAQLEVDLLEMRQQGNMLNEKEEKLLKTKKNELATLKKSLKQRREKTERNKTYREGKKRALESACSQNPELKKQMKMRDKSGRPRIEEDQPELLKAILDIGTHGASADEKRRSDNLRSIKTLSALTEALQNDYGFQISRSGTYLRLLPRRQDSNEGKKHLKAVPIKLAKPQANLHKNHVDTHFAAATIFNLEEVASILGPKEVAFISQDDKARVPIGITAAHKQSPLLMHVEYPIRLPDHDWVVAPSHKLIPSVYAGIHIKENAIGVKGAVGFSGPTYIAIRSGKHSSSTAFSHALDVERILNLPDFDEILKNPFGDVKPVWIFTVDGGPDENPRYAKVIKTGIHHFLKNDLDALFVACNAPGRSAFNRVERRMAPLSKELSGVILPHEHYGTHLDNSGKTIDKEKEKDNFAHAGETLAEIWSNNSIDGYNVVGEYIHPEFSEIEESHFATKDEKWEDRHVRTSQYFLQITKCSDRKCCSNPRSSIFQILKDHFLPPPCKLSQSNSGLELCKEDGKFQTLLASEILKSTMYKQKFPQYEEIPYDVDCPSVRKNLDRKICIKCGLYVACLNKLTKHKKYCGQQIQLPKIRPVRVAARRQRELLAAIIENKNEETWEWIDEDLVEQNIDILEQKASDQAPLITMDAYYNTPWVKACDKCE